MDDVVTVDKNGTGEQGLTHKDSVLARPSGAGPPL